MADIEARLRDATVGPWEFVDYNHDNPERDTWLGIIRGAFEIVEERFQIGRIKYSALHPAENLANARLIANAPSDLAWLASEVRVLRRLLAEREAECERLRLELELERRKDHAYNSWTNGYEAAMADYLAGRTAQWPQRAALPATAAREPENQERAND